MVPDVHHAHSKLLRIREGTFIRSVLYRNRYWMYRINLYQLLLYWREPDITCINAGSTAVDGLHYTLRSKGVHAMSPAARERHMIVHNTGEGWRGGRRETVTLHQPPHYTKMA